MSEKVLIKSERAENHVPAICFGITVVCALLLTIIHTDGVNPLNGWTIMFYFGGTIDIISFLIFVTGAVCFIVSIITGIMFLANRKCELCITEHNVKGKTLGGKEVVLPLSMVSAYVTRRFMSTIAIATASGMIKFGLIKNYNEIGDVLSKKINERQKNTENAKASESKGNNMDDLLKLKSLLDAGVITQEEFDAKKKQLLGL